MKSTISTTIFLFTLLSLASLFFILWLLNFSHASIDPWVFNTKFSTYGILIIIAFTIILFFLQKRIYKISPEISLFDLIAYSAIVCFLSFFIYQLIRQLVILGNSFSNKLSGILLSSIIPAAILTILAASFALRIKKITGFRARIPFILIIIMSLLAKKLFLEIEW